MPNANIDARLVNETLREYLTSEDPSMVKQGADAVTEYTRMKVREDGFFRKILPPVQVTNTDLDRAIDTSKPIIIVDKEPMSPGSYGIPFATLPSNQYMVGDKYRVVFSRIATRNFQVDVDELRTWTMDIRQIISDNAVRDILYEEDSKFITACNTVLGGAAGATVAGTGTVQWAQLAGGITRDTMTLAKAIMVRTPNRLLPVTALANVETMTRVEAWGRDEMGGDLAQDISVNGFAERTFMGLRWIVTTKYDLVPTNSVYFFTEPKFFGKHFILTDTTMHIKREYSYMLEFFAYETMGAAIGNVAGVVRVDFV